MFCVGHRMGAVTVWFEVSGFAVFPERLTCSQCASTVVVIALDVMY